MPTGIRGSGPYGRTDAEIAAGIPAPHSRVKRRKAEIERSRIRREQAKAAAKAAEQPVDLGKPYDLSLLERANPEVPIMHEVPPAPELDNNLYTDMAKVFGHLIATANMGPAAQHSMEIALEKLGVDVVRRTQVTVSFPIRGLWPELLASPEETIRIMLGLDDPIDIQAETTEGEWQDLHWPGDDEVTVTFE
jgi:hypothetical protein